MSKARWLAASYALTLAVGALLWVILRTTGEPPGRAIVMAAILVLAIFAFGLAGMWIWLTVSRSSREDRPFGVFLAFVRILHGSGFLLILWTRWLGIALFSASIAVDLVGRRIARRYLRAREVSDSARNRQCVPGRSGHVPGIGTGTLGVALQRLVS